MTYESFVLQLEIRGEKLTDYLLNSGHVDGASKAKFFLGNGFSPQDPEVLARFLAEHAFAGWPGAVKQGYSGGYKHVIEGSLIAPAGRAIQITSVWYVERGETTANFVTAYPSP